MKIRKKHILRNDYYWCDYLQIRDVTERKISLLKKKKQAVVTLLKHKSIINKLKTFSGHNKSKFKQEQNHIQQKKKNNPLE